LQKYPLLAVAVNADVLTVVSQSTVPSDVNVVKDKLPEPSVFNT
jgi:hypothetical protein